jgi:hypothetical protein
VKKHLITLAVMLAVIFGLVACGGNSNGGQSATPGVLVVQNNTGEDLTEFDISAASEEENWENKNLFDGKVLKHGASIEIATALFAKNEKYDLAFESKGNSYFKMEVDVKKGGTVTIEKRDRFVNENNEESEE